MSKKAAKPRVEEKDLFVDVLLGVIAEGRRDDTLIIVIPSHDSGRPQKRISDQDQWADAGMKLFSQLFGGATAFTALRGIWRADDGVTDLYDEPIMVQSLVKREDAVDESKLELLADFARRLCKDTKQEAVAVFCNDTIHFVRAH